VQEPQRPNQFPGPSGILCERGTKIAQRFGTSAGRGPRSPGLAPRPNRRGDSRTGVENADRYQLSFRDALIVAAAKSLACRYLLTEDLQANQELDGITVVNPFLRDPASVFAG